MTIRRSVVGLLAAALVAGACAQRPAETAPGDESGTPRTGTGTMPAVSGNEQQDVATLGRLKDDARAIARTAGCSSAGQCRAAPMGAKPCGGPWEYVVYCSVTTDSAALYRQLELVRQYEDSLNKRYGRASTCDYTMPPRLVIDGNACRAASP